MSAEELKIRGELEMDVERDLEEEIKDGIYHLALRLHRLYQHQKERTGRELSETPGMRMKIQQSKKNNTVSEVNISIRMEGGTKIEIKEIKKEAQENRTSRSENMQGIIVGPNSKKFDWAKTLRSQSGPIAVSKKIDGSDQPKMLKKDHSANEDTKTNSVGKNAGNVGQYKGNNVRVKKELLELGWRV